MRPKTVENEVVRKALGLLHKKENTKTHNTKAREELDRYFSDVILPKLSALHQAGILLNMGQDPLRLRVEEEWDKASVDSLVACDVDLVKRLMDQFIAKSPLVPITMDQLLLLTLEEFKAQNLAVKIRSKVLGEDFWLVSNEETRDHLEAEGLVCYLPDEILHLLGLSQEAIRKLHKVKEVFNGSQIIGREEKMNGSFHGRRNADTTRPKIRLGTKSLE